MPAKFNLYSAWSDPYFYVLSALFAAALFALLYSIRRYLELKNAADFEEDGEAEAENSLAEAEQVEAPAFTAEQSELPEPQADPLEQSGPEAAEPALVPASEDGSREPSRAEGFVRGIYSGISSLDERLKGIEAALSKSHINNDFTVKFLEDILQDIDSLDKVKIKARIEYLLSDLKK